MAREASWGLGGGRILWSFLIIENKFPSDDDDDDDDLGHHFRLENMIR